MWEEKGVNDIGRRAWRVMQCSLQIQDGVCKCSLKKSYKALENGNAYELRQYLVTQLRPPHLSNQPNADANPPTRLYRMLPSPSPHHPTKPRFPAFAFPSRLIARASGLCILPCRSLPDGTWDALERSASACSISVHEHGITTQALRQSPPLVTKS